MKKVIGWSLLVLLIGSILSLMYIAFGWQATAFAVCVTAIIVGITFLAVYLITEDD